MNAIYALVDPQTEEIRYVGKTNNVAKRTRGHRTDRGTTKRHEWLGGLREAGLMPRLLVLETCGEDWSARERWWIAHLRRRGCNLTNLTSGGQGMPGRSPSAETRRKLSESGKAAHARAPRTLSPEHRAALTRKGMTNSPEHRRRISAGNQGRSWTPEQRAQISARQKGKKRGPLSEETRRKIGQRTGGERNGQAKLTAEDVRTIRAEFEGITARALAERFGISPGYVYEIVRGLRWRTV